MSNLGGADPIEIAALRKRQTTTWDPMAPGPGTPWEDRATHGTVGAFVKTCLASLTGPAKLATNLRRPETTADARAFVIGCGLMWGLSAAGHLAYGLYARAHRVYPTADVDEVSKLYVVILLAVALVGGTVGVVALWTLYTAIYNRLVQQEAKTPRRPEPLLGNVAAYAFGPSILAIIPVVGPPLALLMMLVAMVSVGVSQRLRLRAAAAIIDAVIGFIAVAGLMGVTTLIVTWPNYFADMAVPVIERPKDELRR